MTMMRRLVFVLWGFLGLAISCRADEVHIRKVVLPTEVKQEIVVSPDDPDISNLAWNRWTSSNFTVCSIDDRQAEWLVTNLENIKTWIYTRWGLPDVCFVTECRLICVSDPKLFEKFFNLKHGRVENRKNLVVIFFLLDKNPSQVVPIPLTEACLYEFERAYNSMKFSPWSRRGIAVLNSSLGTIRNGLLDLHSKIDNDEPLYFSRGLLAMTQTKYNRLTASQRRSYDLSATVFCLMLRKEFGQNPFHHFVKMSAESGPEKAIQKVYGFDGFNQLDAAFKRYMVDLTNDVKQNKTPSSYLQINAAGS